MSSHLPSGVAERKREGNKNERKEEIGARFIIIIIICMLVFLFDPTDECDSQTNKPQTKKKQQKRKTIKITHTKKSNVEETRKSEVADSIRLIKQAFCLPFFFSCFLTS